MDKKIDLIEPTNIVCYAHWCSFYLFLFIYLEFIFVRRRQKINICFFSRHEMSLLAGRQARIYVCIYVWRHTINCHFWTQWMIFFGEKENTHTRMHARIGATQYDEIHTIGNLFLSMRMGELEDRNEITHGNEIEYLETYSICLK